MNSSLGAETAKIVLTSYCNTQEYAATALAVQRHVYMLTDKSSSHSKADIPLKTYTQ